MQYKTLYRVDMAVGNGMYITLPGLHEDKDRARSIAREEAQQCGTTCRVRPITGAKEERHGVRSYR